MTAGVAAAQGRRGPPNVPEILPGALAGLCVFLYGATRMADTLGELGTARVKARLERCTRHRFESIGTGAPWS
ncbi:hypothetical protein V3W47_05690 [Deinococcus sp. YIM 134068]|uniref:hypothetical protein n=1 Tax=Deinococcus lichenicola TaxID=3118910 RepID=UPI002F933787